MFQPDARFKIHWEITDLCNLKCPMCPRTNDTDYCRPVKEVKYTQFSFDDVKRLLPETFLHKVKRIDFCGNFGEPCIARDFFEICQYLVKNHNITIMASTNGSMRDPSWWRKLGELLAGGKHWFEFHIDGLEDTNHLYRIGTNWQKVMTNAEAFISGGGRADWHYILFKHNQHQLAEAHDLAERMGFTHFVPTDTGRFPKGDVFRFMHPDGDFRSLEKATVSLQQAIESTKTALLSSQSPGSPGEKGKERDVRNSSSVNGITCKSASQNRFFLDSLGYITPCCWVSNRDISRPGDMLKSLAISGKDRENFNIHNRPIEDILSDELFTNIFPELWQADRLATCRKKCGIKHRNIKVKMKL